MVQTSCDTLFNMAASSIFVFGVILSLFLQVNCLPEQGLWSVMLNPVRLRCLVDDLQHTCTRACSNIWHSSSTTPVDISSLKYLSYSERENNIHACSCKCLTWCDLGETAKKICWILDTVSKGNFL